MNKKFFVFSAMAALTSLFLFGCNAVTQRTFEVRLTNLTTNQALAPMALILHKTGYHAYVLGQPASEGLEFLAEAGPPTQLLAEAEADARVVDAVAGGGIIGPGASGTATVSTDKTGLLISLASMLINTNDGFVGLDATLVDGFKVGESLTLYIRAYDAGTEANSETAATVAGQGGELFNAARDDVNYVSVHPGVVSMDDGLATSALDQSYRFDNPAAMVQITRLE